MTALSDWNICLIKRQFSAVNILKKNMYLVPPNKLLRLRLRVVHRLVIPRFIIFSNLKSDNLSDFSNLKNYPLSD